MDAGEVSLEDAREQGWVAQGVEDRLRVRAAFAVWDQMSDACLQVSRAFRHDDDVTYCPQRGGKFSDSRDGAANTIETSRLLKYPPADPSGAGPQPRLS
jgi:hypothetical protein